MGLDAADLPVTTFTFWAVQMCEPEAQLLNRGLACWIWWALAQVATRFVAQVSYSRRDVVCSLLTVALIARSLDNTRAPSMDIIQNFKLERSN